MEGWPQVNKLFVDGTPYAMKVARTVWTRGKDGDDIKVLPIGIIEIGRKKYI